MPKRPVSVKRLQTMEKKLRGNSIADLRKVGQATDPQCFSLSVAIFCSTAPAMRRAEEMAALSLSASLSR